MALEKLSILSVTTSSARCSQWRVFLNESAISNSRTAPRPGLATKPAVLANRSSRLAVGFYRTWPSEDFPIGASVDYLLLFRYALNQISPSLGGVAELV